MIADGTYKTLLTKWGVQTGAVTKAKVNGAASAEPSPRRPRST